MYMSRQSRSRSFLLWVLVPWQVTGGWRRGSAAAKGRRSLGTEESQANVDSWVKATAEDSDCDDRGGPSSVRFQSSLTVLGDINAMNLATGLLCVLWWFACSNRL
jgi:hypothetical protein